MPSRDIAIESRGLRRTFRARQGPVEAVAGVDLRVEAGEVFGFLGPNGAGKTTTLRMLSTLLPPSGGEATVAGCDLRRQPGRVRERVGYVGQRGGADPAVSGRSELVFQGRLYGLGQGAARRRAAELLASLELEACADRPTASYSGGQRRRLDVALGLVHRPGLLFLDEPTTGLDPQGRARLWDEVRRLRLQSEDAFAPLLTTATLPLLLLSGVLLPMSLAPAWLRGLAAANPLSYAVDAARAVFNDHLTDPSVGRGVAIMAVLAAAAVLTAARAFSRAAA